MTSYDDMGFLELLHAVDHASQFASQCWDAYMRALDFPIGMLIRLRPTNAETH